MKIAIIGAGNVGGALARRWASAGHEVVVGARDPHSSKIQALLASNKSIRVDSTGKACEEASVVLVATPPQVAPSLAEQLGAMKGKVLIDATNAIRMKPEPYPTAYHAFAALTGAAVVKCFNSTGFENMENPNYGSMALDMFMAGDSAEAKAVAKQLAQEAGFENCYDFGGSDRVELLEQFALSWINLAIFQKMGRGIGFKVLKR